MITFDRILSSTKQLSDSLQSSTIDLSRATELVLATVSLLTEYRSDSHWDRVYDYAIRVAELHDIPIDVRLPRTRRRPAGLNDSVIYETVGHRNTPSETSSSPKELYRVQLYYPVLDKFLHELKRRFENQNIGVLKGISALTPNSSNFLSVEDLKSFSEI